MKKLVIILVAGVMVTGALAFAAPQQDEAEQAAFRLNAEKLNRYAVASQALAQLMKTSKNQPKTPESDEEDDVAGRVRNLEKHPGVAAAIRSSGLSTREYVVMGIVMFTAAIAVQMKKDGTIKAYPESISRDNALFVEQNYEKIQNILKPLRDAAKENAK